MRAVTREKDHGRIEKREYFLETDIDWMAQKADWAGLSAIGAVRSAVVKNGVERVETRYFITSLANVE